MRTRSGARTWALPVGVFVVVLAALSVVSGGAAANKPQVAPDTGSFHPVWTPPGVRNAPTTVVVQLEGEPVAAQDAAAPLTKDVQAAIEDQLKNKQAPVIAQIQTQGGQVLASTRSRTTASRCASPRTRSKLAAPSRTSSACTGPAADEAGQHPRRAADRRARRCGTGSTASTARASRSPSSTPASTTPTPTSAARHGRGLHRRARRRDRAGRPGAVRPGRAQGQGRHRPRRRQLQRRPDERRLTSRCRIRTRTRWTATATARTSPARRPASACSPTARRTPAPTTRRRSAATAGSSGPASRRRPTSTRSASSAATARPT